METYSCRSCCGYRSSELYRTTTSKGAIVDIWPDEDMPVDITGRNRADLLMEPGSVISRMNPGRIYEHYVAGMSRRCKHMILEKYG